MLTANNVCFGYEKKQSSLEKLNLSVAPGDKIGIIGKTAWEKQHSYVYWRWTDPDSGNIKMKSTVEYGYFSKQMSLPQSQ